MYKQDLIQDLTQIRLEKQLRAAQTFHLRHCIKLDMDLKVSMRSKRQSGKHGKQKTELHPNGLYLMLLMSVKTFIQYIHCIYRLRSLLSFTKIYNKTIFVTHVFTKDGFLFIKPLHHRYSLLRPCMEEVYASLFNTIVFHLTKNMQTL